MKKSLLLALMALISITSFAEVESSWRMGVRANVGASSVLGEGDKFSISYGTGWIVEHNFSSNFYLQSGIGVDMLSHKEDYIDGNVNALYLNLPINAGYRANIGNSSSFFIQAGPTFGYGVWGSDLKFYKYSINYFDLMKRFDLGVGGRLGFEFSNFQISAGATYGVIPVTSGYNNFNANLGLAYMFNL